MSSYAATTADPVAAIGAFSSLDDSSGDAIDDGAETVVAATPGDGDEPVVPPKAYEPVALPAWKSRCRGVKSASS